MPGMITFDLNDAKAKDYECVIESLKELGFIDTLVGDSGVKCELPYNTYVNENFSFVNKVEAREELRKNIKEIFENCGVKGRFFVLLYDGWTWAFNNVK